MAWNPPLSHFNQYYRNAYAYSSVYQREPEVNLGNLVTWELPDANKIYTGGRPTLYPPVDSTQGAAPPDSLEQQGHYQLLDSEVSSSCSSRERLLLPNGANTASFSTAAIRPPHVSSTSTSEARFSPYSWRPSSSRESFPQMAPATCAQNPNNETSKKSPDAGTSRQELKTNEVTEKERTNNPEPEIARKRRRRALPKSKTRAVYTESQMNLLLSRFNERKYLPPFEMNNLAKMTGLTPKQVRIWFQNQRMKLRKEQTDTSWQSERFRIKGSPVFERDFNNPPYAQRYQGGAQAQLQDQFNQKMMGAPFNTPQNLAFYLDTMGTAPAAAGRPPWLPAPSQNAMATIPQAAGWSMPPGNGQYEYTPNAFNPSNVPANTLGYDTGFEMSNVEPYNAFSFDAAPGQDVL